MSSEQSPLRIVFMGTPDFAAALLRHLAAWQACQIVAAYCQPDRPAGRGHKLQPPAVKVLAQELGIPVRQPLNFKAEEDRAALTAFRPDVLVVAAYGLILPQAVLDIPRIGPFNVHGSLLPLYRGAAPIQRAIMDGNKLTGITIMRMERGLDSGPMLAQRAAGIGLADTAATMHDALADLGGRLMVDVVEKIASGDPTTPVPQDESRATYAPKLTKADGHIDWTRPAAEVHARIRGVTPWPGAQTTFLLPGREPLPVLLQPGETGTPLSGQEPGTVLELRDGKLVVACADAEYLLSVLKPAGGRPMSAEAFWNGYIRDKGTGRVISPAATKQE